MSTVRSYLTIVFQLKGDMIRATEYFGEQDACRFLDEVGMQYPPDRKEIHLVFDVVLPLSPKVLERLAWMKDIGIISSFYVKDEITSDVTFEGTGR